VARFWLDRGVDGFRLDVINYLFHDRALGDNPVAAYARPPPTTVQFQRHVRDRSQPETLAFLGRLRRLTDSYEGRMMVGEIFDEDMLARQRDYTATADRLHTAYSFFLLHVTTPTPAVFAQALESWADASGWPSWSLGNHDVDRFASRLCRSGDPRQAAGLMAALLSLRGTIFVYQGEELGLPQAHVPFERLRDPFAIAAYTGSSGRDGARTPMPWTTDGPSAGFSSAEDAWLPVDPAHRPLAVAAQQASDSSMIAFVKRMVAMRKKSPTLRLGAACVVEAPPGVLAFERVWESDRLLCVFELAGEAAAMAVPIGATPLAAFGEAEVCDEGVLRLPPFAGAILRLAVHG
jgi:alpha-glucosidase